MGVGYRLNHLDEPVFMAVSKPLLAEFGIHHRLESCGRDSLLYDADDIKGGPALFFPLKCISRVFPAKCVQSIVEALENAAARLTKKI